MRKNGGFPVDDYTFDLARYPHMRIDRYDFVRRIRSSLDAAGPGNVMPVDGRDILDIIPHYWTQDARTMEEWFIRFCRAFGLHTTYDPMSKNFRVRLTRDAEDEATITWPGLQ